MRARLSIASFALVLAVVGGPVSAVAAEPTASNAPPAMHLEPTATCPAPAVDEITQAIDFVRGQTWASQPGANALTIAPDLSACRVVLHVGQLSDQEEAALQAGAGSRLSIEYRRDWARPSRVLLILWIIFGGSGLVWVFWRYRSQ